MATCFVIQPFDKSKFDLRYSDTFAPAIAATGLEPYRVDNDPNVEVPIKSIEDGIRNAAVCFAEITDNNPNVWFELGYALAIGKPVVMVCSNERQGHFPFDIQHRLVLRYETSSRSHFETLGSRIRERLEAILKRNATLETVVSSSSIAPVEGLTTHEIAVLATLAGNLEHPGDLVYVQHIRKEVERAGFTAVAVTLAIKEMTDKSLIRYRSAQDMDGNEFWGYSITAEGWEWLKKNQNRLVLKKDSSRKEIDEPLPF